MKTSDIARRRIESMNSDSVCRTCGGIGRVLKDTDGKVYSFQDNKKDAGCIEVVCENCHGVGLVPCDCGGV